MNDGFEGIHTNNPKLTWPYRALVALGAAAVVIGVVVDVGRLS